MCGLLGFASTQGMQNRDFRKQFLFAGFPLNAIDRGMDSSGIAAVKAGESNPKVYKKAMWGGDFVQQLPVIRILRDLDEYPVVLGHVRSATSGRGNITDYNAHPFQYDHITFVHNGHIHNASTLPHSKDALCEVDSAMVAHSMAVNGEMETLEMVQGGFAFIWWNAIERTLNIARNDLRPLHIAYIKGENSLYWSSEITALDHLLRHTTIEDDDKPHGGVKFPKINTWYKFKLNDLRAVDRTPFEFIPPHRNITKKGVDGRTGEKQSNVEDVLYQTAEEWEQYEQTTSERTSILEEAMSEVEEIRKDISKQKGKDAKRNGVPTSEKRINRATVELNKLGLNFMQAKLGKAIAWTQYHNQHQYGSVLVLPRTPPTPPESKQLDQFIEVVNVHRSVYDVMASKQNILINVTNVRAGSDGKLRVTGVVSQVWMNKFINKDTKSDKFDETAAERSEAIERNYDGPQGRKVSYERFMELTKEGCGNCSSDIDPIHHGALVWIGDSPICLDCQTPQIISTLREGDSEDGRKYAH